MFSSKEMLFDFATAFFGCWAIQLTTGITVRNPLTVVLFVCLYLVKKYLRSFEYKGEKNRILSVAFLIVPAILGAILAKVIYPHASSEFTNSLFRILTFAILFVGYFFLGHFISVLWHFLINRNKYEKIPVKNEETGKCRYIKPLPDGKGQSLIVLVVTGICVLFYLPYFLYEYPGIMTADSLVQYQQIIGVMEYSNHHPVIHTFIMKLFIGLGMMVTGDPVKAISFYTIFQMIFMGICYGVMIRECTRIMGCIDFRAICPAVAFLALFPVNAVFTVTLWKDVPFAGVTVLLSCQLIEMYRRREDGFKAVDIIWLIILLVVFSLFRSNAFYAFIAFIPFGLFVFRTRIKEIALCLFLSLFIVIAVKGPLFDALNVGSPDFVESLSLPLQQVARVLVMERAVTEEELSLIDGVIDRTYIKELYVPFYADNIKELVRAGNPEILEDNKAGFLKLYLRLGARYPADYIRAWYDLVGGYIYPDVAYRVGDVDGIMGNDLGLYSVPIIGGKFIKVKEILLKLGDFMPLYGMLFSAGAFTWCLIASFILTLHKRDFYLVHLIMLLLILTLLIASPVVDYRYEYAVIVTAPLWIILSLRSYIWKRGFNDQSTD